MFVRSIFSRAVFEAEGTGGGGTPPAPAAPVVEPKVYSADHVHGLREEAKSHRLRAVEAEGKLAAAEQKAKDATDTATAAATAANARLINAELRGAARIAGLVDLDVLRLLDTSTVTVNDEGDVVVPEDFFAKAKEAKPWAFGTAAATVPLSTSNPARPPAPAKPGNRHARDMTDAEADAEERRLLGRR